MSKEKKISDEDLVEIAGGAQGPLIELDRKTLDDDPEPDPTIGTDRPDAPGGPGNPPENVGGGSGGSTHLG
jgi:hypothetical protein